MKIMFVVNKDITLYLFRKELVDAIVDSGHQVIILSPQGGKIEYFQSFGCEVVTYHIQRRGKNPIKSFLLPSI